MVQGIDPEDRYPHRFDEHWPRPDRIAYLNSPQIHSRAWLVSEVGRLLDDGELDEDALNASGRLPMEALARIVIDLRDERRLRQRLQDRVEKQDRRINRLERMLDDDG